LPRTYINIRKLQTGFMDIGGKMFFHSDRRTGTADISGDGKKLFHRNHITTLITGHLCGKLQIYLFVSGNHANEVSRFIAMKHKSFKNLINILYVGIDDSGLHVATSSAALKLGTGGKQILKGALGISGTGALYKDVKHYFFPIGIVLVLLTLFIVQNLVNSRSGRAITATRDNRIAAESVGIDVTKFKLLAFTVSAALAGVAGVLYAHNLSMLKVSGFDYNMSILILVYVVLGGIGNLRGSIIATVILYALPELLRGFANYRMLIYAIVLIIMMLFNWAPAARNWRARVMEKIRGTKNKKEAA